MALFGFSILTISHSRSGGDVTTNVNHAGAMIEAASEDEARGKAMRILERNFPGGKHSHRGVRVWPAGHVVTVELAEVDGKV